MYIYILDFILICAMGILFVYYKNYRKFFIFSSFFIIALTLGFRGSSLGEDTQMYLSVAEISKDLSFIEIIREFPKSTWSIDIYGYHNRIETIYLLYNKIIMSLTGEAQFVLLVSAIISCWGFGKFIYDNSSDIFLSTYVFLCESFFMFSFNGMRQVMAISIGINSYTCIKNKKYKKGLLLICLASLFHQSALIYLSIFVLDKIKNKQKSIKYIFIVAIILTQITPILYLIVMKFSPYYASYFQSSYWEASANGIIILWFIELLMIGFIYFNKTKNIDDYMIISYTIFYLAVEIIGLKYTAISRVALYFRVFLLLLFPRFKQLFKRNQKAIYMLGICTILGILYFKTASKDVRLYSSFFSN